MTFFISLFSIMAASLLVIPVAVFLVEVVAAIVLPLGATRDNRKLAQRPSITVLVPAHNEGTGIERTLAGIKTQLREDDRLLVVADNCTDDTATLAAKSGAEVVERHDPLRRGKGYALELGVRHLATKAPSTVIFIDADCQLEDGAIDELAIACAGHHRPIQALYLMRTPANSQVGQRVAEFAWRVKNGLRPEGLRALGLPCQLVGTGMAFPWDVLRSADLASGSLVEDLKLGLDLAMIGYAPLFCPAARVTSEFASLAKAAASQRERWEHGHIKLIFTSVPSLLGRAIACGNLGPIDFGALTLRCLRCRC